MGGGGCVLVGGGGGGFTGLYIHTRLSVHLGPGEEAGVTGNVIRV